ncbi:small RNA 2-O-methyltransferase [Rhodotorula toruloides]|uniref:Small RNA 2'-O-methyltransferase n=1 Tax=Rhodotorula toruloides TaxID=5286 RepID=A0A511KLU4_RHOTO|nr:small RNA 2-O-methyltransferase [Rhodotorula toruloides]
MAFERPRPVGQAEGGMEGQDDARPPSRPHSGPASRSPPQRSRRDGTDDEDDLDDTYGTGHGQGEGESGEQRPFFFPPLWLNRRTACVTELKKAGIRSVADVGCGAGTLLSILTVPAYHKDDFPSLYPPAPWESQPSSPAPFDSPIQRLQTRQEKLAVLRSIPRARPEENELHLRRLIGIDIERIVCDSAANVVKPATESSGSSRRWEELFVEIYEGGVEVHNDALLNVEAIVLTEVIEHLTPTALARLPNLLFSVYSPRLIVITTPNHSFNPYFVQSPPSTSRRRPRHPATGDDDEESHLHPDPSGRTNRMFRDPTHLFEWTPEEFRSWCEDALTAHSSEDEYELRFTGVGSLASYYSKTEAGEVQFPPPSLDKHPALASYPTSIAPPENPREFFATQIAVFTKRFSGEPERSPRSARPVPLPFFTPSSASSATTSPSSATIPLSPASSTRPPLGSRQSSALPVPHKLVYSTTHRAHPATSYPASSPEILSSLSRIFLDKRRGDILSLADVWRDSELRETCGGEVGRLVDALVEDDEEGEWELSRSEEGEKRGMNALGIRWRRYEEREEGDDEEEEDEEKEEEQLELSEDEGRARNEAEEQTSTWTRNSGWSAERGSRGEEGGGAAQEWRSARAAKPSQSEGTGWADDEW